MAEEVFLMSYDLLYSESYVRGYSIIPWAHGETIVAHWRTHDYTGDWIIIAFAQEVKGYNDIPSRPARYVVYKDRYGSCTGCDSFQRYFDPLPTAITRAEALAFVEAHHPLFAVVTLEVAQRAVDLGFLDSLLPKNVSICSLDKNALVEQWTEHIQSQIQSQSSL